MIIDTILNWFYQGARFLILQLPTINFDCSSLSSLTGYLSWIGGYVNLPLFVSVLAFVISTEVLIWLVQFIVWLYDKIPLT